MARKQRISAIGLVVVLFLGMVALQPTDLIVGNTINHEFSNERKLDHEPEIAYTNLYTVNIGSNTALNSLSSSGYGNSTHPYILEDYAFLPLTEMGGAYGWWCLRIMGTTAHFVLRDCLIDSVPYVCEGIQLWNVDNGRIERNTFKEATHGIYLRDSTNITIYNNTFLNHRQSAIRVYKSDVNITGNTIDTFFYNGIWLETCSGTTVYNNEITSYRGNGIFIDGRNTAEAGAGSGFVGASNNHAITYNNISGTANAIVIYGSGYATDNNTVAYNRVFENTISGISVYAGRAYNNTIEHNTVVDNTGSYGIHIGNRADNNTIEHNTIVDNSVSHGVYIDYYASDNTVAYNTISNNTNTNGVVVNRYSDSNEILHNVIQNNAARGVYINDNSQQNLIYDNDIWESGQEGLLIASSSNNDIYENDIRQSSDDGIHIMGDSMSNTFDRNVVSLSGGDGVCVAGTAHLNLLIDNHVAANDQNGFRLTSSSHNNTLEVNFVEQNGDNFESGILVESGSHNNTIVGNWLRSNFHGVELNATSNNTVLSNTIFANTIGICLTESASYNEIQSNDLCKAIYGIPNLIGIQISENAFENKIENNTIGDCTSHGLVTDITTFNNTVRFNNFVENNLGGSSQAFLWSPDDDVVNNFWNEWTSPDSEPDGIVDIPYQCDGPGYNDSYPLALPSGPVAYHYLTQLTVIYPNGGELINNTATIQWAVSTDPLPHDVEYRLWYSSDGGDNWILIVSGLDVNQYEWNTTEVVKGTDFKIRAQAYCTGIPSASIYDTSDSTFTLQGHSLATPEVNFPNGGEEIIGEVRVSWADSFDTWEHEFTYTVSYSSNGGSGWTELASSLTVPYYDWNTTTLPRGFSYLVKVAAICSEGLTVEDVSDSVFTIERNHIVSTPTIITPNGAEVVNGSILIQWADSSDLREHDVNYTLYYSDDGGESWFEIVSDLTESEYLWNTTLLSDGSDYLIKVVAICEQSVSAEDISDGTFTIQSHTLSVPTVLYPNGGEILNDSATILWVDSTDPWGHDVTYSLYYSSNGGSNWIEIVTGLDVTSYWWNTTELPKGTEYLIKVVAVCTDNQAAEDASDGAFALQEHTLSIPTVTYPNGLESLNETVRIEWQQSTDSWSHHVTYSVYYSPDFGSNWIE
ncbi:MAG: right-handed parallel beta-helix repeat-containing protein, partial [Candidatus Thorarchaeota archaeon]